MNNLFIEAGHNHLGKIKEANKILNFFLKSNLKNITFMCHSDKFYNYHKNVNKINLKLEKNFFLKAIEKTHKQKKKIGLSVSNKETFTNLIDLNFDFYKLLSESINNFELVKSLKRKRKKIYISTGYKAKNSHIKKAIKILGKRNTELLHTPMTYNPEEINLKRINELKKLFNMKVGYSNHFNDINIINILPAYKVSSIFFYCKPKNIKSRIYPDNNHAFSFDEIDQMLKRFSTYVKIHDKIKRIKKITIFDNEIKI